MDGRLSWWKRHFSSLSLFIHPRSAPACCLPSPRSPRPTSATHSHTGYCLTHSERSTPLLNRLQLRTLGRARVSRARVCRLRAARGAMPLPSPRPPRPHSPCSPFHTTSTCIGLLLFTRLRHHAVHAVSSLRRAWAAVTSQLRAELLFSERQKQAPSTPHCCSVPRDQ